MTVFYAVVFMLAVIAVIFAISALLIWLDKKTSHKQYDERQRVERGKAYRFSTWVGLIYFLVILILQAMEVRVEGILFTTTGIMLMLVSFLAYSTLTGCYLTLTQRPLGTGILFLLLGVLQAVNFAIRLDLEPLHLEGRGAFSWIMLMLSVCYFTEGCAYLYIAWKERE